ncbi:Caltractin [Diplonema papillatum]|nr:Caltractin [Diplonema papillatum]
MAEARVTRDEVEQAFNLFDTDSTGYLDEEELAFALKSLGYGKVTKTDVNEILGEAGGYDSRRIEREHFIELVERKQHAAGSPQEVRTAFKLFDLDGSGYISLRTLQRISAIVEGEPAPDKFLRDVIKAADADQDGELNFDEFANAVTKYAGRATGGVSYD